MIDFLLEYVWVLVANLFLGITLSILTRRLVWRLLGWFFISAIVAAIRVVPHVIQLWNISSEGTGYWLMDGVIFEFPLGLIAAGLGILIGLFIYRVANSKGKISPPK